jgi:hypothetical protein
LEARAGIEPAHKGFADLSLTTWVPRLGMPAFWRADRPIPRCTSSISVGCDAEWSGRRDLNSRPSPWQGDALPLSYSRLTQIRVYRGGKIGSNHRSRYGGTKGTVDTKGTMDEGNIKLLTLRPADPRTRLYCFAPCLRSLTHPAESRRLRNCEGCGLFRLPPASSSLSARNPPAVQALEIQS